MSKKLSKKEAAEGATLIAYKGLDKNFQCRGYQFEVGKTYEHDGPLSLCNTGFHACEAPLDVFSYYPPGESQYAAVTLGGANEEKNKDSKRVGNSLAFQAKISVAGLIEAQIAWVSKRAKGNNTSSGDYSMAASSGDSSTAASSGDYSKAASSGDYSKAACDTNGFACVAGLAGCVKGGVGSALSVGYRDALGHNRIAVGYVGENGIKPDVYYILNDAGEFQEVA